MLNALKMSESLFSRYYLNEAFNDIHFNFALRDDIKIGEPFSVILVAKNRSKSTQHTINGNLRVDTVHYTGKVGQPVKLFGFNRVVKPLGAEEVRLDVTFDEYYSRLVEQVPTKHFKMIYKSMFYSLQGAFRHPVHVLLLSLIFKTIPASF